MTTRQDSSSNHDSQQTTLTIDGTAYVLGSFDLNDFTAVEAYLIRRRRKERLQLIADMRDSLPDDLWQREWEEAKAEAEKITSIDPEEVSPWIETREGMTYVLWLLFNRRYPGVFTMEELQAKVTKIALEELKQLTAARKQAEEDERGSQTESQAASEPADHVAGHAVAGDSQQNE